MQNVNTEYIMAVIINSIQLQSWVRTNLLTYLTVYESISRDWFVSCLYWKCIAYEYVHVYSLHTARDFMSSGIARNWDEIVPFLILHYRFIFRSSLFFWSFSCTPTCFPQILLKICESASKLYFYSPKCLPDILSTP